MPGMPTTILDSHKRGSENHPNESPSSKRNKKEWLAFRGSKHTRVGTDFQVTLFPTPPQLQQGAAGTITPDESKAASEDDGKADATGNTEESSAAEKDAPST
eukprot:scaffold1049_cov108-Cylindrotheca_fusiformis.AAC.3